MKRVIGLFAAMLIFLSRCGPNNMVAAANMAAEGDIILRVPLLRTGPLQCIRPHPRRPQVETSAMLRVIPRPRMSTKTASGSDTIPGRTIRTTIWTIRGSMGILRAGLGLRMCGD